MARTWMPCESAYVTLEDGQTEIGTGAAWGWALTGKGHEGTVWGWNCSVSRWECGLPGRARLLKLTELRVSPRANASLETHSHKFLDTPRGEVGAMAPALEWEQA